jgi:hypothetical protein
LYRPCQFVPRLSPCQGLFSYNSYNGFWLLGRYFLPPGAQFPAAASTAKQPHPVGFGRAVDGLMGRAFRE